jgi:hypothetical protein
MVFANGFYPQNLNVNIETKSIPPEHIVHLLVIPPTVYPNISNTHLLEYWCEQSVKSSHPVLHFSSLFNHPVGNNSINFVISDFQTPNFTNQLKILSDFEKFYLSNRQTQIVETFEETKN